MQIEIGSYWECVKATGTDRTHYEPGDIGLVIGIEEDHVQFYSGEKDNTSGRCWMNIPFDELLNEFKPITDGPQRRSQWVLEQNAAMLQEQQEIVTQQYQLQQIHVSTESAPGETTAMVKQVEPKSMTQARQGLTVLRNTVRKHELTMKNRIRTIEKVIGEQTLIMEKQMAAAQEMIKKFSEVIFTFDLYLGKSEDIVQLASGEPASDDEKITIRQLTLHMDEEAAVNADEGGIDCTNIEEFDKWITASPKHLRQVLPEARGVVAIQPRRNAKVSRDADPWTVNAKTKMDKKTYWLIRNGECLYRICTILDVGDHIVPFDDEYDKMFTTQKYVGSGEYERAPIKPGDSRYMEAMEQAEGQQRHYMRILLFLQGLIDRTKVFHPLPHGADRINVMSERTHEEHVRYVYDADPKKLLTNGRPVFLEWLEELNRTRLEKGHRIIGAFDSYETRYLEGGDKGSDRRHPTNAGAPNSLAIHTIDRRDGENFVILYEYNSWRGIPAKNRASYRIHPGDTNIIPIDFVTTEEIEYYLNDRLSRRSYMSLFPLLQTVIAIKSAESKAEAPFRKLLAGQLMSRFGWSLERAEEAVIELVPWWKFKNRTHRALLKDDTLALNMILDEAEIRDRKERVREKLPHERVVKAIRGRHPGAMYVGHKTEREYVVLVPSGPNSNVFVDEFSYRLAYDDMTVKPEDIKYWRGVDKRRLRWMELYSTESWKTWNKDAYIERYLTDMDIEAGIQFVKETMAKYQTCVDSHWDADEKYEKTTLLAINFDTDKQTIHAVFQQGRFRKPKFADAEPMYPSSGRVDFTWSRKNKQVVWVKSYSCNISNRAIAWWDRGDNLRPLFRDADTIQAYFDDWKSFDAAHKVNKAVEKASYIVRDAIVDQWAKQAKSEARRKFFEENGHDAELWEVESKGKNWRQEVNKNTNAPQAFAYLYARGIAVPQTTLENMMALATLKGWKPEKRRRGYYGSNEVPVEEAPIDLVIKYPQPEEK